jgi:hypothetical protein
VPLTVLTLVLAEPVVRLVLDRGDRSLLHLIYTAVALRITAAALVIYAAERVIMQAFFSLQRMWAPALLGIAAAVFQVGGLMVAIHLLAYDYPVQIFYLVALAYPASRLLKNLLLLLVLKRHVSVLPARPTLVFAGKLALLSTVVGAAAWLTLGWTERVLPCERFRLKKVIVDTFEILPETWYSTDADELTIAQAPGRGAGGNAVRMAYRRHSGRRVELRRDLSYLATEGARQLHFARWADRPTGGLAVRVDYDSGRSSQATVPATKGREWSQETVQLSGERIAAVSFWEPVSGLADDAPNVLCLDDFRLAGADGGVLFNEDFDGNGWKLPAGAVQPAAVQDAGDGRLAVLLPAGVPELTKGVAGYDLSGTDVFRCRVRVAPDGDPGVQFELRAGTRRWSATPRLSPGEWNEVRFTRRDAGFDERQWGAVDSVQVCAPKGHSGVLVDDVTFRREPRPKLYALIMFAHCALPTAAGIVVLAAGLVLMRFEELDYVVRWVKERGWRKRREAEDQSDGAA